MLRYWLWLAERPRLTAREKLALLEHFRDPEDIYHAGVQYLAAVQLSAEALVSLQDKDMKQAEAILSTCDRKKIRILTLSDDAYPRRLKNIYDPPLLLYCKGRLPDFDAVPVIGVVGTREASAYGLSIAQKLSSEIAACGAVVISGMAKGVDAMATNGALQSTGFAAGVLGCGVDRVYPFCNRDLFIRMERSGCLISEYPPGTKPDKWNFPQRNRIISGISCGVLVVEAPEKSGALITARQALEQGRDVFVVPGNIDTVTCRGSNALLREGAIPVSSGWEVVSEYQGLYPDRVHEPSEEIKTEACDKIFVDNHSSPPYSDRDTADLTREEQAVLKQLTGEQLLDTVIADSGLTTPEAIAAITMLEIKGLLANLPGGRVVRI